jgi:hypothetical protein
MDLNQVVTITAPAGVFTTALAGMRKLPIEHALDAYQLLEHLLGAEFQKLNAPLPVADKHEAVAE